MNTFDEGDIPDLVLRHRGEEGFARFRSTDDLGGKQIKALRKAAGNGERGDASNNFYELALGILVINWQIPTKPELGLPRTTNASKIIDEVPAKVLRALERHIRPYLDELLEEKKESALDEDPLAPGSPTRPDSD